MKIVSVCRTGSGLLFPIRLVAFLLPLGFAFLGCNSQPAADSTSTPAPAADQPAAAATEPNLELQGKILVDGSSTVFPISEAAASEFRKKYPNVNIPVGSSGTGNGFERFITGQIEISDASRPIKKEEWQEAKKANVPFVEIPIAYDGLTIVVHKNNDWVDQLTVDELKKIFTESGKAKNWSDVRAGWPERAISIFAPGTASGTFDYFKEVVAGKGGELRADMSTSEDDNVLVTGVSGSPDAIGFFGVAYFEENKDKLKAIPVVNPETNVAVMPTATDIESGAYAPFSRPLFIYVAASKLGRPDVKRFVQFYLQEAPSLARETGYVPLPEEIYQRALKNAQSRTAGTHYLTADGEQRHGPVMEVFQDANLTPF
jgi:phosphate transport system substrate-binding protein